MTAIPMSDLLARYKRIPVPERTELVLSAELEPHWRPCILRDQDAQVKAYFARRADLSNEEVGALLADPNQTVRLNCARRADLTPEQIERCVADRDPNLRYFIARSPQLTDAQRQQLLADPDPLVQRAAAKGPKHRGTRQRPGQAPLIR
jgi:hypothetical protein